MTDKERKIVGEMLTKGIGLNGDSLEKHKEIYARKMGKKILEDKEYFTSLIVKAKIEKNEEDLENILGLSYYFNLFDDSFAEIFVEILGEEWHCLHENIVDLFKKYQWTQGVDILYQTALKDFDYMKYDEFSSLAVRCIWALKYIGTKEAKEKLKLLAEHSNKIISRNAKERLEMLEK